VPFPCNFNGETRLPRVLRETTSFILLDGVVQTEGIFRLSPPIKVREIVKEAYDRGQKFMVWKEAGKWTELPQYPGSVGTKEAAEEMAQEESFGVHVAASMIKLWYMELRVPMIPEEAYKRVREVVEQVPATTTVNATDGEIQLEDLVNLFSPGSDTSPLGLRTRTILSRHLFPLMWEISEHREQNKMTPENLAICFAPTLLCGHDQMEDVRMAGILKKVLATTVERWPAIRQLFGIEESAFRDSLKNPKNWEDFEDPLDHSMDAVMGEKRGGMASLPKIQTSQGIVLQDNDATSSDYDDDVQELQSVGIASAEQSPIAPPLPPRSTMSRPVSATSTPPLVAQRALSNPLKQPLPPTSAPMYSADQDVTSSPLKRKPAPPTSNTAIPPLVLPPRYSTVMNELSDSPSTYVIADGFGPPRRSEWSIHDSDVESNIASGRASPTPATISKPQGSVKRKPVGSSSKDEHLHEKDSASAS
jgi:Rho GTPase-activating protein 1